MSEQTYSTSPGVVVPVPPRPLVPRTRGGVGFGIFLIVLGALVLSGRFVAGVEWWNLWPLLIVVAGLVHVATPDPGVGWGVHRVAEGVWIGALGVVLLGNTTGYLSWSLWAVLLTLWPVLLISLGIRVLSRGLAQPWLRAFSPLVLLASLAVAVAVSWTPASGLAPLPWHVPAIEWTDHTVDIHVGPGDDPVVVRTN